MTGKSFTIPSIFTAVDRFTSPLGKMQDKLAAFGGEGWAAASRVERRFSALGDSASRLAQKTAIAGAAVAAPLILAAREAVMFEDKLADVGKTTGIQGQELKDFGGSLLDMAADTRTSIDDLTKIGEIGGQLGVAKDELLSFTEEVNKFNVAIGADFAGGVDEAVSSIGNIKTLFEETRKIPISEAIKRTGSVINELGAVGSATSANISDFTLRLGALPDAIKPSVTNTMALGAFLEESGINSQIASGGLTNLFLVAAKNLPKFAAQMGMGAQEAQALFEKDPTEFAKKFAASLNGLSGEDLAKALKKLEIGSQETIKVVGALGAGTERLTALQEISSKAFADGTSLQNEYNKKNSTTQAQLDKVINSVKALAIVLGTELLPYVVQFTQYLIPLLKGINIWIKENPTLARGILYTTAAVSALLFTVSIISGGVAIFSKLMIGWTYVSKAATTAQWLWNAAMLANPIGLILIAIAAMIAAIIVVIAKWNEWGAVIALMLGPIGWLISIIQSLRRNWTMITDSFKNGGIIEGIKAIGNVLFDALLMPLQQALELIAKFTGADWAASAAESIKNFRTELGVNTTSDESGEALQAKPAVNPKAAEQDSMVSKMIDIKQQNVAISIVDPNNRTSVKSDSDLVPIRLGSTVGFN